MLRYTMVSIMKIYACNAVMRTSKIDQTSPRISWMINSGTAMADNPDVATLSVNRAISTKINSLAYMLPNSRRDSETGLAISSTNLRMILNGASHQPKGWVKNSLR